jgi:MurNAc alpha-1-phosphate uridylyltransferase
LKLVIEVDGSIHLEKEVKRNDDERPALLEAERLIIIRFTNDQVLHSLENVINSIEQNIRFQMKESTEVTTQPGLSPLGDGGVSGESITKAMIFAAGLGTRFKPWTDKHPKALAVINGKSLLQRNIEYLQQYGIKDVVVNVHHFADQIIQAVEQNKGWGSKVTISDESDVVLETGGGLLKARPLLGDKTFVSVNSDMLTDLDLAKMIAYHQEYKPLITIATTARKTSRYFLFDDDNRLCGWRNASTGEEKVSLRKPGLKEKAYSTVAIFEPQVFDLIPFTGKFSLVDVYLALAPEHVILSYDHTGDKLLDVGKPENVPVAEQLFP